MTSTASEEEEKGGGGGGTRIITAPTQIVTSPIIITAPSTQ